MATPTTLKFADDFNAADGTALSGRAGTGGTGNWVIDQGVGSATISGNRGGSDNTNYVRAHPSGTYVADQAAELTYYGGGAGYQGPLVRYTSTGSGDSDCTCYGALYNPGAVYLAKFNNGAVAFPLFHGVTVTNGDTLRAEVVGNLFYVYRNGAVLSSLNGIDLTTLAGTYYSGGTPAARFLTGGGIDDFAAYDDSGTVVTALAAGTASFVSSGAGGITVLTTPATGGTGAGPTDQWERSDDGGAYADLAGATGLSLTDATAVAGVLYRYRCKQTRGTDTVTTNVVLPGGLVLYEGGPMTGGGGVVVRDLFAGGCIR
jgi:hypothetical protein